MESLDELVEIDEMTPEAFGKVLKHLPEPTVVEVALFGNFDYSDISRQAQAVIPNTKIGTSGGLVYRLEKPSKEKALEIYEISHALKDIPPTDENPNPKRIGIHNLKWYIGRHVQIELDPWKVEVKYRGQKPDFVSRMEQELAGTDVQFTIGTNYD